MASAAHIKKSSKKCCKSGKKGEIDDCIWDKTLVVASTAKVKITHESEPGFTPKLWLPRQAVHHQLDSLGKNSDTLQLL